MARQLGPVFITGTLSNITFYQRDGQWLARKKTSLNKERVNTDPAFKNSRAASKKFARAAKIAKAVYWQLPPAVRKQGLIGKITGEAVKLLTLGHNPTETQKLLLAKFG